MVAPIALPAALEQIREVVMGVAELVQDVGLLAALQLQRPLVLHHSHPMHAHRRALLGEGLQFVHQEGEVDGDFQIRIAEHSSDTEVVLGSLGLLLEALEDAADVDRLLGGLLRKGLLKVDCPLHVEVAGLLLLEVAQPQHLTGYETRKEAVLVDDVSEGD
jgi:hypothetical protein